MMKKIVYTEPDGRISVVHPSPDLFDPGSRARIALAAVGITFKEDAEVLAWLIAKDVPGHASDVRVVDQD